MACSGKSYYALEYAACATGDSHARSQARAEPADRHDADADNDGHSLGAAADKVGARMQLRPECQCCACVWGSVRLSTALRCAVLSGARQAQQRHV